MMETEAASTNRLFPVHIRILVALLVGSYGCFFILTLLRASLWVLVLSVFTVGLMALLSFSVAKGLGKYRLCAVFVGIGMLFWCAADLTELIQTYVFSVDAFEQGLSPLLILFPNYFFGLSLTVLLLKKIPKGNLASFLITSFLLAVVLYVFCVHLCLGLMEAAGEVPQYMYLRAFFNLAVNVYILLLLLELFVSTDPRSFRLSHLLIFLGMMVYLVIDFRYLMLEATGVIPENPCLDLIYLACMGSITLGLALQCCRPGEIHPRPSWVNPTGLYRVRRITGLIAMALWVLLFVLGVLNQTEFFVLLTADMAYLLMSFSDQASQYKDQLLNQEKQISRRLEEEVREKTRDLVQMNEHLEKVSSTDTLTGLYNRRYGKQMLDQLIQDPERKPFAVFSVDLNYFKPINDNYGHEMGDRVLTAIGERLLRHKDRFTSFRFGGDEFLVVQPYHDEGFTVERTADILRTVFDRKIEAEGYEFALSASIGIALFPKDASRIDELLRCADSAMYSVKHKSRKTDVCYYEKGMLEDDSWREEFQKDLSEIDPERDFYLHYQPQFDAETGEVVGAEALLRFRRKGGYVAVPETLIKTAEETGLINTFGRWIVDNAVSQISEWNRKYEKNIPVTINISPIQLMDPLFLPQLLAAVRRYNASPAWVNFELREENLLDRRNAAQCRELREYGFSMTADNVTEDIVPLFSILEYGISGIRLSEKLVSDLGINDHIDSSAAISGLIGLAKGLGIPCHAAGVENLLQLRILKYMGCRVVQGYYFQEAVDPAYFEQLFFRKKEESGGTKEHE